MYKKQLHSCPLLRNKPKMKFKKKLTYNSIKRNKISCRWKWKSLGHVWPHGLYSPWDFPGQNTGVGSLSLLQCIFPTQGANLGLPHCRRILYQLSHNGSPRILKWVAYPFSSRSSWPRNWTRVSHIACDSLLAELPGKPVGLLLHENMWD